MVKTGYISFSLFFIRFGDHFDRLSSIIAGNAGTTKWNSIKVCTYYLYVHVQLYICVPIYVCIQINRDLSNEEC